MVPSNLYSCPCYINNCQFGIVIPLGISHRIFAVMGDDNDDKIVECMKYDVRSTRKNMEQ